MFLAVLSLLLLAHAGESSRILGVFPSPGYSQFILAERLMTELAKRGHEVVVISPFQPKRPVENYTSIVVDAMIGNIEGKYVVGQTN